MEKINEIIFKELLKRGYSLDGKTRVWNISESRLMYITPEQAQAYLDLELSPDYNKEVIQKEVELIKRHIEEIIKKTGKDPLNVIDMGCGDGKKAEIFIEQLKGKMKLRYCPIDISDYMVNKAIERMSKMNVGEIVQSQWNISDFENIENISSLLRQNNFKKNLILILGNTIGNFEFHELMHQVSSSMKKSEVVLIGNGLSEKNIDTILKSYSGKMINNFLIKIPLQLGLKEDEIKFGARFKNSRVEIYYEIKTNKKISCLGKNIDFNEGDQIIVAVSYKYKKDILQKYLKMYFDEVKVFTLDDKSYALALCKK
jgi:uncharacterized SAM-dependent methyltransferase